MRVLVDTGVFSASLSRRRRSRFEAYVGLMAGQQIFLSAVTVSELRYGALVAGWGDARRERLEKSIQATTVVPVSDKLLTTVAELRLACRLAGIRCTTRPTPMTSGSQHRRSRSGPHCSPPTASSTTLPAWRCTGSQTAPERRMGGRSKSRSV